MSFDAIVTAERLEAFVDVLDAIVDEARIQVTGDGLKTAITDPANVATTWATLEAEGFESYGVDGGQTLGVTLEGLTDALGFASSGDLVYLSSEEAGYLEVAINSFEAELSLIDPDTIRSSPDQLDVDQPVEVVVEAADLATGVKASDMVGDHTNLKTSTSGPEFIIEGMGDTDAARVTLEEDDLLTYTIPSDVEAIYSTDYMKDQSKVIPDDTEVTISFDDEFPVCWSWVGEEGTLDVEQWCAPRIQAE